MALDKHALQGAITTLLTANIPAGMRSVATNPQWPQQQTEINNMAAAWADALYDFVTNADVIYAGNLQDSSGPVTASVPTTTIANIQ